MENLLAHLVWHLSTQPMPPFLFPSFLANALAATYDYKKQTNGLAQCDTPVLLG